MEYGIPSSNVDAYMDRKNPKSDRTPIRETATRCIGADCKLDLGKARDSGAEVTFVNEDKVRLRFHPSQKMTETAVRKMVSSVSDIIVDYDEDLDSSTRQKPSKLWDIKQKDGIFVLSKIKG